VLAGQGGEAHVIIPARPLADIRITTAVPIDLTRVLADAGGKGDMALQDGDIISILRRPDSVVVDGAVSSPGPHPFVERRTVGDYIHEAGSKTRDADMRQIVVVHTAASHASGHGADRPARRLDHRSDPLRYSEHWRPERPGGDHQLGPGGGQHGSHIQQAMSEARHSTPSDAEEASSAWA
jgi:hypothetical protein